MSTTTAPQTELDAVNMMLRGIFEAPVNSLDVPGVSDAGIAKSILADTRREVLAKGWHFNKEKGMTLSPDSVSGMVPIPNNALRIDGSEDETRDVSQRGLYLYDKTNHTLIFTSPVKVDVTFHFEWSEMPEHAKYYIAVRSARKFQDSVLGEGAGRYKQADEDSAKLLMEDAEGDDGDHNILLDNYTTYAILSR